MSIAILRWIAPVFLLETDIFESCEYYPFVSLPEINIQNLCTLIPEIACTKPVFYKNRVLWKNWNSINTTDLQFESWIGTETHNCKGWLFEPSERYLYTLSSHGNVKSCSESELGLYCIEPLKKKLKKK